ncbi:MAG TPA: homocysteine biosynthesis protein [Desulfomonilaceae bacterium]|nr:homocysteine biosynthesis protein [Desulfomonilaceae bacterium]
MSEFKVNKTFAEINRKIKSGEAVVLTAEEMISVTKESGPVEAARKVDVVTTGTFGIMCSSGAFLNFGHAKPRMRANKVYLNGVEAYAGIAAVDCYIGATQTREDDPLNKVFPGRFRYGGGHVIEDLVAGREVLLQASSYGTDCYPKRSLEAKMTLKDFPDSVLLNPRNAYQNYNCAVNLSKKTIYTYMGILRPEMMNANFSTSGQLSPLLNDPLYRTIGIGTRIFLGGGVGYVIGAGTQHTPTVKRSENGVVMGGAGTLSVRGDLKGMSAKFLRGASITGYGTSLNVGIGIPIPILNEEMARFTSVSDAEILVPVVDYGSDYPAGGGQSMAYVSYAQLRSGEISVDGKTVSTAPLSSYSAAREIATILKEWIESGKFLLGEPQETLPSVPFQLKN